MKKTHNNRKQNESEQKMKKNRVWQKIGYEREQSKTE